jgi:hypothetical protein
MNKRIEHAQKEGFSRIFQLIKLIELQKNFKFHSLLCPPPTYLFFEKKNKQKKWLNN